MPGADKGGGSARRAGGSGLRKTSGPAGEGIPLMDFLTQGAGAPC